MKEWGFFIKKHIIFDLFMQMICNHKICTSNVSYHDFFTSRWCVFTSRWWLFKKPCCTQISIYNFHLDCVCVIIIWCKLWCNHNLRKSLISLSSVIIEKQFLLWFLGFLLWACFKCNHDNFIWERDERKHIKNVTKGLLLFEHDEFQK